MLLGAAAQLAVPAILRRVDPRQLGEMSADVAPAPATFAVWAPIMALSGVHGLAQARPGRAGDSLLRRAGWPTAAAFASTGVWAPLVARARWWPAQAAITSIWLSASVAQRRIAAAERESVRGLSGEERWLYALPIAMLAGWSAAATGVNLASMLVGAGLVAPGAPERTLAAGTVATLGAVGVTGVRTTGPRTFTARAFGATVLWALGGVAVAQRRRFPAGAATALTAAAAVGVALSAPVNAASPAAST